MLFKKEFLIDLVYEDHLPNEVQVMYNKIMGKSRWDAHYEMVFKCEDKFYKTSYTRGLTEYQDNQPYEYDEDEIECQEVKQVEIRTWGYI